MISPVGISPTFSIGRIFHRWFYRVCQIVKIKIGRKKKKGGGGEEEERIEGGRLFITNV